MLQLCPPAFIYVIFSLTHIIIDTFKGLYNTAFFKFIVSILVTILLDALCKNGMSIISWLIVFIPFIFMTFIVSILLYVFGLDIATGKLNLNCLNNSNTNSSIDPNPDESNPDESNPDESNPDENINSTNANVSSPPSYSTDPAYQS
jgi:predicted membrane protein